MKTDNPNKLQQDYDSAILSLLMDEYTDKLGERVLQEYEQAEEAEDTDDSIDAMCYQIIRVSKPVRNNGRRIKKVFRRVGVVAAVIVILLAMLIGVQAAGVDVFGALAKWTGEVFRFQTDDKAASGVSQAEEYNEMQQMLAELDMPVELAPTWIPEGYTILSIEQVNTNTDFGVCAAYENDSGNIIVVGIKEYHSATALNSFEIQMDNTTPEEHISNGKLFYLFTNTDKWRGAWCGDCCMISLSGFPSREMMIRVIDSIGEMKNE